MNLTEFADETASESPAPGGGSISAYCGSLGASLGTMVANLSAGKRLGKRYRLRPSVTADGETSAGRNRSSFPLRTG